MNKQAKIGLFALVMLMTGAIDGISNLPSIAIFGQQLVFFFIVASILFLLPTGLISAELCSQFKTDSGVYFWSKKAFGQHAGAVTIWLQWINTMVWFPTCLTTLTGTFAYLIDPNLTHHPLYLVATSLSVFWIMTWLNLKGVKESVKIASLATTVGMVIPLAIIIGLVVLWIVSGKPFALTLTHAAIVPPLSHAGTWASLTAIIASFLGMELATVHVRKVANAHKVFPKALVWTIVVVVLTMGLGSLGVALVIPHKDIELVAGTMQAFNMLFTGFHVAWLEKVLGVMLLFGTLGTMVNWLISPANGLAQAAADGYLPKSLAQENDKGCPAKLLIVQGVVVSLVSLVFFLLPSVNGAYWFLLDLSTELYVIMYVFMFLAALKHISTFKKLNVIPGGKMGGLTLAALGLLGSLITIVVGFLPPSNIPEGGATHFILLFGLGLLAMVSPVLLLLLYKIKNKWNQIGMETAVAYTGANSIKL